MKKFSKKTIFLTIVIVIIAVAALLYFVAPSYLYNKAMSDLRKSAGLTVKTIDIPDFKIVYAEGGTGDTIVMLHGFGGNKDNWLRLAKFFTPHYHVVIPDLPGFGESSKPADKSYNIKSQVERLNLLVKELKLEKFHIIGNSMGGSIAGTYAATYPERVKTLGLFNSGGVKSPVKSELTLALEEEINPLVVKSVDDYDRLLHFSFVKPIKLPYIIKNYLTKQAMEAAPLNEKIFEEITESDFNDLESKLDQIEAPTLVLWGDSDKIINVSAANVFKSKIKNAEMVIIEKCGHVPMLEKPAETASAYGDFLKSKK